MATEPDLAQDRVIDLKAPQYLRSVRKYTERGITQEALFRILSYHHIHITVHFDPPTHPNCRCVDIAVPNHDRLVTWKFV